MTILFAKNYGFYLNCALGIDCSFGKFSSLVFNIKPNLKIKVGRTSTNDKIKDRSAVIND